MGYTNQLPLFNGNEGTLSGVCLDEIPMKFQTYPMRARMEDDIKTAYKISEGNLKELPKSVGGNTDFMIGIKYLRYYPEKVFQLPSGLSIYISWFKNADGTREVIGRPHKVFTEIESASFGFSKFCIKSISAFQIRISSESGCITVTCKNEERLNE